MSRHDQALFARAISAATAAPKGRNAGAGLDNNPSRQAILPAAKSSVPRTKQPSTKQSSHAKWLQMVQNLAEATPSAVGSV